MPLCYPSPVQVDPSVLNEHWSLLLHPSLRTINLAGYISSPEAQMREEILRLQAEVEDAQKLKEEAEAKASTLLADNRRLDSYHAAQARHIVMIENSLRRHEDRTPRLQQQLTDPASDHPQASARTVEESGEDGSNNQSSNPQLEELGQMLGNGSRIRELGGLLGTNA